MSDWIELTKTINIDVDGQDIEIEKDIQVQIDYVECEDCGKELSFTMTKDGHQDIQITVERCNCGTED